MNQITQTTLEAQKALLDLELTLTKYEGHPVGGTIGYWLHDAYEVLTLIELDCRAETSSRITKPVDWSYSKKYIHTIILGIKQVGFMLAMGGRINKRKENPNDVMEEYLSHV